MSNINSPKSKSKTDTTIILGAYCVPWYDLITLCDDPEGGFGEWVEYVREAAKGSRFEVLSSPFLWGADDEFDGVAVSTAEDWIEECRTAFAAEKPCPKAPRPFRAPRAPRVPRRSGVETLMLRALVSALEGIVASKSPNAAERDADRVELARLQGARIYANNPLVPSLKRG